MQKTAFGFGFVCKRRGGGRGRGGGDITSSTLAWNSPALHAAAAISCCLWDVYQPLKHLMIKPYFIMLFISVQSTCSICKPVPKCMWFLVQALGQMPPNKPFCVTCRTANAQCRCFSVTVFGMKTNYVYSLLIYLDQIYRKQLVVSLHLFANAQRRRQTEDELPQSAAVTHVQVHSLAQFYYRQFRHDLCSDFISSRLKLMTVTSKIRKSCWPWGLIWSQLLKYSTFEGRSWSNSQGNLHATCLVQQHIRSHIHTQLSKWDQKYRHRLQQHQQQKLCH